MRVMKGSLIEILACPACLTAPLEIQIRTRRYDEIVEADLLCPRCRASYRVEDGIPIMLTDLSRQKTQDGTERKLQEKHKEVREANITYYDAVAQVYEDEVEQEVHQSESNQRRMDRIVESLARKTEGRLFLDLGCGTGNVLKLGNRHFHRAVGLDVSLNMLKVARQNGLEVIQGDTLFLPFKPSLFDAVSIFSVLHHIYDYNLAFSQIGRVLKTGGYLYSDWDPTRKPQPSDRKIAWGIYRLLHGAFEGIRPLKHKLRLALKRQNPETTPVNFAKIRPDLTETQAKAEFHNITDESNRGIDFRKVESQLVAQGFQEIQPTYHQSGLTVDQLRGVPLIKTRLLAGLGFDPEPFLENIQILARKGVDVRKQTSQPGAGELQKRQTRDPRHEPAIAS